MIEVQHGKVVYSFSWPCRIRRVPGRGYVVYLPWWGRPYRALMNLFGRKLINVRLVDQENSGASPQRIDVGGY